VCRIAYSEKGWTNGEIGVEWIEFFDEKTNEKGNGQHRLLLVDGQSMPVPIKSLCSEMVVEFQA
jgi:hypothetical protein